MKTGITYHPKNATTINVKLEGKIVGAIKTKKDSPLFCYVPKGQSYSKGLYDAYFTLEEVKKVIEGV